jgi:hypothetical protein
MLSFYNMFLTCTKEAVLQDVVGTVRKFFFGVKMTVNKVFVN